MTGNNRWASPSNTSQRVYARCNFSTVGLTNSSEGFETHTAACLLSLIPPNTQGSERGLKDLNNTCSCKESLRKFAEAKFTVLKKKKKKCFNGKSRKKSSSNVVQPATGSKSIHWWAVLSDTWWRDEPRNKVPPPSGSTFTLTWLMQKLHI